MQRQVWSNYQYAWTSSLRTNTSTLRLHKTNSWAATSAFWISSCKANLRIIYSKNNSNKDRWMSNNDSTTTERNTTIIDNAEAVHLCCSDSWYCCCWRWLWIWYSVSQNRRYDERKAFSSSEVSWEALFTTAIHRSCMSIWSKNNSNEERWMSNSDSTTTENNTAIQYGDANCKMCNHCSERYRSEMHAQITN